MNCKCEFEFEQTFMFLAYRFHQSAFSDAGFTDLMRALSSSERLTHLE